MRLIVFACPALTFAMFSASCTGPRPEFGQSAPNGAEDAGLSDPGSDTGTNETVIGTHTSSGDETEHTDATDTGQSDSTQQGGTSGEASETTAELTTTDTSTDDTTSGGSTTEASSTDGTTSTRSTDTSTDGNSEQSSGTQPECTGTDTQPCPAEVSTCEGAEQTCSDGTWGECSILPEEEDSCSMRGDDSNCDGEPNDGCDCIAGETRSCADEYGSAGVCGTVELTCTESGRWPAEDVCSSAALSESCAGDLDEDCDGEINEAEACPCAVNPCQNGGVCDADGSTHLCDCTGTGFAGQDCGEPVAVVLPLGPGSTVCSAVSVSNDASTVGATCNSRPAYWSQSNGWQYLTLPLGYSEGTLVDVTPDGGVFLATLKADDVYKAALWSSRAATGIVLTGFDGNASAVAISGDGQRALGNGSDGTLLVWSGPNSAEVYLPPGDWAALRAINHGGDVVWGDTSSGISRWNSASDSNEVTFPDLGTMNVSDINDEGDVVIGLGWTNTGAAIWRYQDGQLEWLDANGSTACLPYGKISSDGSRVAGGCGWPIVWIGTSQLEILEYLELMNADVDLGLVGSATYVRSVSRNGRYTVTDYDDRIMVVRLPE